jgi:antitoxin ParD1/3/4
LGLTGYQSHLKADNSQKYKMAINGNYCHADAKPSACERVMSINISLPPELENRVRQRVESGLYGSASEVVREALRLLDVYEQSRQQSLACLQADIRLGMADVAEGNIHPADAASIKQRARELMKTKGE